MEWREIESVDGPELAVYRDLKQPDRRLRESVFIGEGEKVVRRMLESPFRVLSVLASDRFIAHSDLPIPDHVERIAVPHERMRSIVGFHFHRGVLACAERPPPERLEDHLASLGPRWLGVFCPALGDPENLGQIIRLCAAFGVAALFLGPSCPDPLSRRILRVSMGTVLRLPWVRVADVDHTLGRFRSAGLELVAAAAGPGSERLAEFRPPPRMALLLGAEGDGLDAATLARCQRRVGIPMAPGVDSLNVAVALGIILHEIRALPVSEFSP